MVRPWLLGPAPGHRGALVWDLPDRAPTLSSASVGGGLIHPAWVLNIGVAKGYDRTDLADHAAEVAAQAGLHGEGCALFTAADVTRVAHGEVDGISVSATVGISDPTWPVTRRATPADPTAGTINIVVQIPDRLSMSALVQAVGTVTEAKAQALIEQGVDGIGTPTDAVVVRCAAEPRQQAEPFAGVRSRVGLALAEAVHAAVSEGVRRWRT